jgi:hypothetical protein
MTTKTSSLSNDPPENQASLQQALRTLRGIRRRFEIERTAHPEALCNLHVALGDSDMNWIDATIEALEKPIAAGATEAAGHAAQTSPGSATLRIIRGDGDCEGRGRAV